MARLSSTSTESDYVPAMVPFRWEVAPGRSAANEILDAPSLPLPPGQRPKDGFYLPYSRPAPRPLVHNSAGAVNSHSRQRRSFNLKFPGSLRKPFFTNNKHRKVRENTHAEGIFSPVAGHRFSSRITRRVLVEFQKRRSCLGGCLLQGRKGSLPQNHQLTGRRLDSINGESHQEEIQEPHPATRPTDSGYPLSSSSSHGHGRWRNSSVAGAREQSQVQSQVPGSSRFLASMLMFLCNAELGESDEAEAVDEDQNEISGDIADSFRFTGHVTMPRARVFSPGATSQGPQQGIVADKPLSAVESHGVGTQTWVGMSTDMSESLQEEPAMSNLHCEHCGNRKFLQPGIRLGTGDFTSKSDDQSFRFQDRKGSVADVHAARSTEASPDRNFRPPTKESCETSLSWKARNQIRAKQDPRVVFMEPKKQEPLPQSSRGDPATLSFITNSSVRSQKVNAAPPEEPASLGRRDFLEEQLEPNQPPVSRPISSLSRTLLQNQAEVASPKDFRIKDKLSKAPGTSAAWLEALKSSPRWPNPAPKTRIYAATDGETSDESGNDLDNSSVESSEDEAYRAVSQTPSPATPVRCARIPPRKPATWEISQKLLKSSSMLKYKHQQQQSHESPRSSFLADIEKATISPSPNNDFKQADLAAGTSLPKMLKSNYGVMSKVAEWESKAGVGSSGKSLPIYLSRRRGMTIKGKAVSR